MVDSLWEQTMKNIKSCISAGMNLVLFVQCSDRMELISRGKYGDSANREPGAMMHC